MNESMDYVNNRFRPNDRLQNGYSRQEYYDQGFSYEDIEYWGLDQPGAPDPHTAGFVIMDIMDEDYDGEMDWD